MAPQLDEWIKFFDPPAYRGAIEGTAQISLR
jgi:hypothetical protein